MIAIGAALAALAGCGLGALLLSRWPRASTAVGAGGGIAACLVALPAALRAALGADPGSLRAPWLEPLGGEFHLHLDPLAGFFLLPILGLGAVAALYGAEYLLSGSGKRSPGPAWFFYDLLVASLVLVVTARNALLFLVAWEAMTVSSFFLVTWEHEKPEVRKAGWTYLAAAHLGTAFLLAMFLVLAREARSLDFGVMAKLAPLAPSLAGTLFALGLVGFGTKAGLVPFHVWLPEAHPAAPSHVSALMSGVMIKTGIYGLLRLMTMVGPPPAWFGWLLAAVGLASALFGITLALAQTDLKRMLAYSSVENLGLVAVGLGIGTVGLAAGRPEIALPALAFALLHVANHAMMKGLLFLGAGAVLHATHTREIDRLGGLAKRMRATATAFLVGSAAISALPPLCGLMGEVLLYLAALRAGLAFGTAPAAACLTLVAGVALVGGLVAAGFARAFGIVFLGEPRTEAASHAHEAGPAMRLAMGLLAAGCVAAGLAAPVITGALGPAIQSVSGLTETIVGRELTAAAGILWLVVVAGAGLVALVAALAVVRARLLAGRTVGSGPTWDCGYAAPTARMQYTGTSFSQPLVRELARIAAPRETLDPPRGLFPPGAAFLAASEDLVGARFWRPTWDGVRWALSRLMWLQHGRVQLYVLYIALTLLALMVWKLRG